MDFELISQEENDNLPIEDDRCFVEFENICRRNMTRMISDNTTDDFDQAVREQYASAVTAVAIECNVPNIKYSRDSPEKFWEEFSRFSLAVQGEVARIRIRQRGERHTYSVLLTGSTRTKIEHYISRIRDMIDKSEIDLDRKKRLHDKLDQLINELGGQRVKFAKTMAILVAVTTTLAGSVTIAADGPNAIAHIMALIGQDKESEEAANLRLTPPPKALPAPAQKPYPSASVQRAVNVDIEDDMSF